MPKIEVLCGPIASGKSGYARRRASEGWIVICDDSIVEAVHAGQYQLYDKGLKPLYKTVENAILSTAIAMGLNVVVDIGRCVSRKTRERWIALGRSLDADVECVVFERESSEIHAARRVMSDGRGLSYRQWLHIARHHESIYSPPSTDEGFAEIHHHFHTGAAVSE